MPRIQNKVYPYLCIGVDPGIKGGVATITHLGHVTQHEMPDTELGMVTLAAQLVPEESVGSFRVYCCIERVHSMPKQSAQSGFTFGRGYGAIRTAFIAAGVGITEVDPKRWQKELGIPPFPTGTKPAEKKRKLLRFAQQMFPKQDVWIESTKGTQLAVCDAILIAEYCRRINVTGKEV